MKSEYHKQEKAVFLSLSRLLFGRTGEKHRVHWQGRTTFILPIVFFFFSRFVRLEKTMVLFNTNRFLNNPQSSQSRSPISLQPSVPPPLFRKISHFLSSFISQGRLGPFPPPIPKHCLYIISNCSMQAS